jgi:acyl dehydratase
MAAVFETPMDMLGTEGQTLGTSEWMEIDQDRVNMFADATGDHQWIHINKEMAEQSPFGTTIAHGFLTLSLLPMLMKETYTINKVAMGINYGCNKVRFINPVKVGSRVRGIAEVVSVEEAGGGIQLVVKATIEIEGEEKPACVAETVTRLFG